MGLPEMDVTEEKGREQRDDQLNQNIF